MNLSESLSVLRNQLVKIDAPILEAAGHLEHPEDLIFTNDIQGAKEAISKIEQTISNPHNITIKFDGVPALVFGRGPSGKFSIMDKHMFNKKDGSGRKIYSPDQFVEYDHNRGANRGDLYETIKTIWPGLEKADRGSNGYYWGDLLFSKPLDNENGLYKFQPNPNGISYTVDVKSDIGRLLTGKVAGLAVHQFIPADATSTDQAVTLNGTIGNLENNSDVAIVPSKMPITPKLKINTQLKNIANSEIANYGGAVVDLMNNPPQAKNSFAQLFISYINKKVASGNLSKLYNDFVEYVNNKPMTDSMRAKLQPYIQEKKEGVIGIFKIWIAIYNLKMDVVNQLNKVEANSPVKGYLQDGTQTHEGFVANGLKFVDRQGFSSQLLGQTWKK
jgi:Family of unknown function (DUF6267)